MNYGWYLKLECENSKISYFQCAVLRVWWLWLSVSIYVSLQFKWKISLVLFTYNLWTMPSAYVQHLLVRLYLECLRSVYSNLTE